jgi:hypothetical protein
MLIKPDQYTNKMLFMRIKMKTTHKFAINAKAWYNTIQMKYTNRLKREEEVQ